MTQPSSTPCEDSPARRLLRAIFPELDSPMANPVTAIRSLFEARTLHQHHLVGAESKPATAEDPSTDCPSADYPSAKYLSAQRLEIEQQVELLYRSVAGEFWLPAKGELSPSEREGLPDSRDPIVSALRRIHKLPGLLPLDPLARAALERDAATPLRLYRQALEEARLLDADSGLPLHLDLISLHLEDPAPVTRSHVSRKAWDLLKYTAVVYRGIQQARNGKIDDARTACSWISERPMPHDPLLLSAVAELQARTAAIGGTIDEVVQPLIMSTIVLQDEPWLQARMVELAVLRLQIHEERGETRMASKTFRWLAALAHHLDHESFPALSAQIESALLRTEPADRRPQDEWPIVE